MSRVHKFCLISAISMIPVGVFADTVLTTQSYVNQYAVKQAGWESESRNKFLKVDNNGNVVAQGVDMSSKQDNLGGDSDKANKAVIATGTAGTVNYRAIETTAAASGSTDLITSGAVYSGLSGKQDTLTIDTTPTQASGNPISSGAVYTELAGKQNTLTFDDTPTATSANPVKSGGVYTALAGKQDNLVYDNVPTADSQNMVKSGAIYTALSGKQDTLTIDTTPTQASGNPISSGAVYTELAGKQNTLTFDNVPTENSNNPVKSGGVYTELAGKQGNLGGTIEVAGEPVSLAGRLVTATGSAGSVTYTEIDSTATVDSPNPISSGAMYTALASKQDTLTFDNVPTENSNNPVKSGGVYTELAGKVANTEKTTTIDGTASSSDDAKIPTVGAVESYSVAKSQLPADAGKSMVVEETTGNVIVGYPKIPVNDTNGTVVGAASIYVQM